MANARAAEQAEAVPEKNEEGKVLNKKEKAALQKAADREVEATAAVEANRMEPEASLLLSVCILLGGRQEDTFMMCTQRYGAIFDKK